MTSIAVSKRSFVSIPDPLRELFRREPRFAGAVLCLAVLVLPTLVAMWFDTRTLLDVSVWTKPLKFELSLIIYLVTLCWFADWLPDRAGRHPWYRAFSSLVVLFVALEMVWLIWAASNGIASHFNYSSLFMQSIYGVMGVLAITITSASLMFGVLLWRDRNSSLDPTFRISVSAGLCLTFVLTVISAGYLASQQSHFVGGTLSDANGVPLVGWARDGGDLRTAHFFATHALHFIPAFGLVASRTLRPRAGRIAVLAFSTLFTLFVGYVLIEAISGRPLIPAVL